MTMIRLITLLLMSYHSAMVAQHSKPTLRFTTHALKRIKERNITTEQILAVIKNGTVILNNHPKKTPHATAFVYNGMKVVYETKKKLVITAIAKTCYNYTALAPIAKKRTYKKNDYQRDYQRSVYIRPYAQ